MCVRTSPRARPRCVRGPRARRVAERVRRRFLQRVTTSGHSVVRCHHHDRANGDARRPESRHRSRGRVAFRRQCQREQRRTATVAANGEIAFTPATGFSGPTTVSYVVANMAGAQASGQVSVTVTPVPHKVLGGSAAGLVLLADRQSLSIGVGGPLTQVELSPSRRYVAYTAGTGDGQGLAIYDLAQEAPGAGRSFWMACAVYRRRESGLDSPGVNATCSTSVASVGGREPSLRGAHHGRTVWD